MLRVASAALPVVRGIPLNVAAVLRSAPILLTGVIGFVPLTWAFQVVYFQGPFSDSAVDSAVLAGEFEITAADGAEVLFDGAFGDTLRTDYTVGTPADVPLPGGGHGRDYAFPLDAGSAILTVAGTDLVSTGGPIISVRDYGPGDAGSDTWVIQWAVDGHPGYRLAMLLTQGRTDSFSSTDYFVIVDPDGWTAQLGLFQQDDPLMTPVPVVESPPTTAPTPARLPALTGGMAVGAALLLAALGVRLRRRR